MKVHKSISSRIKKIFASKDSSEKGEQGGLSGEERSDEQQAGLIPSLKELTNQMVSDGEESEKPSSAEENANVSTVNVQASTIIGEQAKTNEQASSIPSLEELTSQIVSDGKESKKPSSAEENANISAVDVQDSTLIDELAETGEQASSIPSLKELTSQTVGDDDKFDSPPRSETDEMIDVATSSPDDDENVSGGSSVIFSLYELAERMELPHESETKKESSKKETGEETGKEKGEVSREQLSDTNKSFRTSEVKEEGFHNKDLQTPNNNYINLLAEINEAKAQLTRLERWHNVALSGNMTVRGRFLGKEINNLKAKINTLQGG